MSASSAAPIPKTQFASDNTAGVCPEAWEAMARANRDYAPSYGTDAWTERAANLCERLLSRASPLGLYGEELDAATGRHLGNYPQAFSHVSLVNTAHRLSGTGGTAVPHGR